MFGKYNTEKEFCKDYIDSYIIASTIIDGENALNRIEELRSELITQLYIESFSSNIKSEKMQQINDTCDDYAIRLLDSLMEQDRVTYYFCISKLNKMLLKNDSYVRNIGMTSPKYKRMINKDYYYNYQKAQEALRKINAKIRF